MSAPKTRRSKKTPRPELPPNIAAIACAQDGYACEHECAYIGLAAGLMNADGVR